MKYLKALHITLIFIIFSKENCISQSTLDKLKINAQIGYFFTGYRDRTGDKLSFGVSYHLHQKGKINLQYSRLIFKEEFSLFVDDNVLIIDINYNKYPLKALNEEQYHQAVTNIGTDKKVPGYFDHLYSMYNLEYRYTLLQNRFSLNLGLGASYIKADIVEKGTKFPANVEPLENHFTEFAYIFQPILLKYRDYGYTWSINMGYKLTDRTNVVSTVTHSAYKNSTGPVSMSVGLEFSL